MSKMKIGARELTDEELALTLPTYRKIEEQIDEMRTIANENKDIVLQKTNNIGILGVRGAGKTSILHTLRKKIREQNNGDIILEIIIPENMSESSTLMETILGLLKHEVDVMESGTQNTSSRCIHLDSTLHNKYNEVVRTFTYIQKNYREILISEFTNENEYIKKSKEVFNSDSEFIKNWKEFLVMALEQKKKMLKEQGIEVPSQKEPMLIVFIDDIDLSTYRCTDVVKTLLSYLSSERVITFLSGDIDTFEEALTLDFLRKEQALDESVFEQVYYNVNKGEDHSGDKLQGDKDARLIERKKLLAYEYLKKVIPPTFRHQVKVWNVEERASYIIQENENSLNLGELLCDRLRGYIPEYFFRYQDNHSGKTQILPYFFELFDSTSRGLNNVYSVLNNIEKNNDGSVCYEDRKLLLETIIASNADFSVYRDYIQEKLLLFGVNEQTCKIDFARLIKFVDTGVNYLDEWKGIEFGEEKNQKAISFYKAKIQMKFILLTFFAKHLLMIDTDDMGYQEEIKHAKKVFLCYLCKSRKHIDSTFNMFPVNDKPKDKEKKADVNIQIQEILDAFLLKGDIGFDLIYFENCKQYTKESTISAPEKYLLYLYQALEQTGIIKKTLFFSSLDEKSTRIVEILSRNNSILLTNTMFNTIVNRVVTDVMENTDEFKALIYNTLSYEHNRMFEEPYHPEIDKEIFMVLERIDRNGLWNHVISEKAKEYVEKQVKDFMGSLQKKVLQEKEPTYNSINELEPEEKIVVLPSEFTKAFDIFRTSKKGGKTTKANELYNDLNIFHEKCKQESDEKLCHYTDYIEISDKISKLAYNNRVWYGRIEARNLLAAIRKARLVTSFEGDNKAYLYYFIKAFNSAHRVTEVQELDKNLQEFKVTLTVIQEKNSHDYANTFIDKLNEGFEDDHPITMERFEELFI